MTLEDKIAALLDEAAPLRLLPDDEAEAAGLPKIVERINALRAKQSAGVVQFDENANAPTEKRKPGRPRKAE